MLKQILTIGAVASAFAAIVGLWIMLGFPIAATSGDIERLDRKQTDLGIEVYQNKLRGFYAIPPPQNDPRARQLWQEDIGHTRKRLELLERRKLELEK